MIGIVEVKLKSGAVAMMEYLSEEDRNAKINRYPGGRVIADTDKSRPIPPSEEVRIGGDIPAGNWKSR